MSTLVLRDLEEWWPSVMCCLRNLFSDGFQTISNYFAANLYLADSGDWWPRMYWLFTDCIQTISKFSQALAVANFLSLGNLVIAGFLLFPTSWSSLGKLWEYLKIIVHAIMLVAGEWWWCRSNKTPEMKLIYIGGWGGGGSLVNRPLMTVRGPTVRSPICLEPSA